MHPAVGPGELIGERIRAHRQRIGVRHFENGRHPTENGCPRPGLQVFFMNEPRLTKMYLGIDDAGKNMKAAAVDPFAGRRLAQGADLRDPPVTNANVSRTNPFLVDGGSVDQDAVEAWRHLGSFLQWRECGLFDSLRPCKRDGSPLHAQESRPARGSRRRFR